MTPVLPVFAGFVPSNISCVLPNASVAQGSQWEGFPSTSIYTMDTFLEPQDEELRRSAVEAHFEATGLLWQCDAYLRTGPV